MNNTGVVKGYPLFLKLTFVLFVVVTSMRFPLAFKYGLSLVESIVHEH